MLIVAQVVKNSPRHDFRKKKLRNIIFVFGFSLGPSSETFLVLRRTERDITINVHRSSCEVPVILSDFNETWIFRLIFEKSSNIKFNGNPSSGSRVVPCGQTDRPDETNSRFSQFCERALKKKTEVTFFCILPICYNLGFQGIELLWYRLVHCDTV